MAPYEGSRYSVRGFRRRHLDDVFAPCCGNWSRCFHWLVDALANLQRSAHSGRADHGDRSRSVLGRGRARTNALNEVVSLGHCDLDGDHLSDRTATLLALALSDCRRFQKQLVPLETLDQFVVRNIVGKDERWLSRLQLLEGHAGRITHGVAALSL